MQGVAHFNNTALKGEVEFLSIKDASMVAGDFQPTQLSRNNFTSPLSCGVPLCEMDLVIDIADMLTHDFLLSDDMVSIVEKKKKTDANIIKHGDVIAVHVFSHRKTFVYILLEEKKVDRGILKLFGYSKVEGQPLVNCFLRDLATMQYFWNENKRYDLYGC